MFSPHRGGYFIMIQFGKEVCSNFGLAIEKEWLETNGLGGFASSTVVGANTRRYHALLTAAIRPPTGRIVMLSKLEETLVVNRSRNEKGKRYELSCNQYPGVVHPQGHRYLELFRLEPFPTFVYRCGEILLKKSIFMVHGENTTVLTYQLLTGSTSVILELRPLIAFRDYHATTHENSALDGRADVSDGWIRFRPYPSLPPMYLCHEAERYSPTGYWYRNFIYVRESERGLDDREDLFNHGVIHLRLSPGQTQAVIASLQPHRAADAAMLREREMQRRARILAFAPSCNLGEKTHRFHLEACPERQRMSSEESQEFVGTLMLAADQFLVKRSNELTTVIAGYHWFTDWGRDTMISLPGLTLVTGRFDEARSILRAFARYCNQGMIPNRFCDSGEEPEYNTADATLWMFHAVRKYLDYTGDVKFALDELYPVLSDIVHWHIRGTRYNIRMESDGLLHQGEEGLQLTWMDAKIGDWVVTPRRGKAVEVNALWFNALRTISELARMADDARSARQFARLARRVKKSFETVFWNEKGGYLYDCVDEGQADDSIRPNQVIALSLPHRLLPREKERRVLEVVILELLTPFGLRTLSPNDPLYRGHYGGDQRERDSAYHQGTVWAWLLGPFVTAYVNVHGRTQKARREASKFLHPMREHLKDAGLGSISEIFDGDPPHRPAGCIAQAWSVAEILRAYVEDLKGATPSTR